MKPESTSMTSPDYEIFESWDEISEGDLLTFKGAGSLHIVVRFERTENLPWTKMVGSVVEDPAGVYNGNTDWSSSIFTNGPYGNGWARVRREYKYDPSQQGDTEEDI